MIVAAQQQALDKHGDGVTTVRRSRSVIVDRRTFVGRPLTELARQLGGDAQRTAQIRLLGKPRFGLSCPHNRGGDRAQCHTYRTSERVVGQTCRGRRDHHCVARADLGITLIAGQERERHCDDDLVGSTRVLLHPDHEVVDRYVTRAVDTLEMHDCIQRTQDR